MRVTTAFNKILGLVGATVASVEFRPEGVVVGLRRRRQRHRCGVCGWSTWAARDHSVRRWRHVDLGGTRLWLEYRIARIECRGCRAVRTEAVPWARHRAHHTRDLEDIVAWLAQRTDKTTITRLLRVSWEAVAHIVEAVVADHLDGSRLDELYNIGVDEVSFRKGHRYLTVIANHDADGAVVWAKEGKDRAALEAFFDELGPERTARLRAVSMDMGFAYQVATDARAPQAIQCVDPYHVVALANRALERLRQAAWRSVRALPDQPRRLGRRPRGALAPPPQPRVWMKRTRWALLKDPAALSEAQWEVLATLRSRRSVLYRGWQLKEALRDLYRLGDAEAAACHLDRWLGWACRSRIPEFVALSRTIRANRERILAAVRLGLSNSKLEGLNSKIRLINHRGYGHHSAAALIAMIYLCAGGITISLPLY